MTYFNMVTYVLHRDEALCTTALINYLSVAGK